MSWAALIATVFVFVFETVFATAFAPVFATVFTSVFATAPATVFATKLATKPQACSRARLLTSIAFRLFPTTVTFVLFLTAVQSINTVAVTAVVMSENDNPDFPARVTNSGIWIVPSPGTLPFLAALTVNSNTSFQIPPNLSPSIIGTARRTTGGIRGEKYVSPSMPWGTLANVLRAAFWIFIVAVAFFHLGWC